MANEISIFRDAGAAIPAHLQGVDDLTRKMMSGSGSKRISIRGSVFRMIVDGQEVAKNEDRSMDVVIVNAADHTSRSYYDGVYQEGQNTNPVCWSNDGITPDSRSENLQATKCADCAMNIAGSGQGTTKACRFSRRLAVVMSNDIDNSEVYQLTLPAQSIFGKGESGKMPLGQYVNFLAGHNLSIRGVVTEIRFDTNSATPKLTFRAVKPLSEAQYLAATEKGNSQDAINAITYNPIPNTRKAAAPVARPQFVAKSAAPEEPAAPAIREKKAAPPPADLTAVIDTWGDDE